MSVTLHPSTRERRDRYTWDDTCPNCNRVLGANDHTSFDWTDRRGVIIRGHCRRCKLEYQIIRPWPQVQREYEEMTGRLQVIQRIEQGFKRLLAVVKGVGNDA